MGVRKRKKSILPWLFRALTFSVLFCFFFFSSRLISSFTWNYVMLCCWPWAWTVGSSLWTLTSILFSFSHFFIASCLLPMRGSSGGGALGYCVSLTLCVFYFVALFPMPFSFPPFTSSDLWHRPVVIWWWWSTLAWKCEKIRKRKRMLYFQGERENNFSKCVV